MTKAKIKEQPALFGAEPETPVKEGAVKKNTNLPPKTERPPPPKAQIAPKSKGGAVVPFEPARSVLQIVASLATNPSVDVDKMRALIEIQRDTEAKEQFHAAMLAADEDLPRINRDGSIEIRGGKPLRFASFENVNKVVKPILRRHGLRLTFQPDVHPSGNGLVVHCHLTKGLYRESCTVPVPTSTVSRAMNDQQAVGNAISYAKRYGTIALLNLETEAREDRDLDGATAITEEPTISGEQTTALVRAIDDCGIAPDKFMGKYKIEALHMLPAKLFAEAMKACANYKARAAQKQHADG